MRRVVLGLDLAMVAWPAIGTATIHFDDRRETFTQLVPRAIVWPDSKLTPANLAEVIDSFARANNICAIGIDGPQGWRHPETELGIPGAGRRCEYACRTQGKTGVHPKTYPGNQRPWIEFSIQLFDELLAKPGVELADAKDFKLTGTYAVLECFPTSAWRTSGLTPLPAKAKRPPFPPYIQALQAAYALPPFTTKSHDDLQAVMAALAAVGAVGGPVIAMPEGVPSSMVNGENGPYRVEGLIWNVAPRERKERGKTSAPAVVPPPADAPEFHPNASMYVTQRVLDQVARTGDSQMQIASSLTIGGNRRHRVRVSVDTGEEEFKLLGGDTHVIWRTHQDPDTIDAFDRLYGLLSDQSGIMVPVALYLAGTKPSDVEARRRLKDDLSFDVPRHEGPARAINSSARPMGDFDAASRMLEQALAKPNELSVAVPVAMLLQSWNADFYRGGRSFDASHFARIDGMLTALRPQLDAFRSREPADVQATDKAPITQLFTSLASIVGATGASIVMHLWAPDFFPEWAGADAAQEADPARDVESYWTVLEASSRRT